jgi:non-specific serine/threonine protein kinase
VNKAYSNKALPAGTVLREWRLEEVLGVGGFGIVYKAKGIYFGELVAIKEYFPSSISERDGEDTVVPIDSDAEEVHALGLKKFVEEAKLLWNLSTPTRHPNIVSVRSLFEIHGTAYIVMDFEDGVSLSRMLKQGRRFNERSLWNILRPVAEGLERAHRVGVLHRDIKPPNILINEDNRPVLIDFGSARFTTAEATSTTVTFHTPPYAAIEQYVKTYDQGPWTDIYALGVVMYECVTGEKPAEVLERLHAGMGKPLAEGKWPGYSKKFLAAIDAAMTIKPEERPQSISDWLAMFGKKDELEAEADGDDEATRFIVGDVGAEEIVPVPPPTSDIDPKKHVATAVPDDPKQVRFKRLGQDTDAKKKTESVAAAKAKADEGAAAEAAPPAARDKAAAKPVHTPEPPKQGSKKPSMAVMAGIAAAVLVVGGGGALLLRGGKDSVPAATSAGSGAPATNFVVGEPAAADTNVTTEAVQNTAVPAAQPGVPANSDELKKESARATAAEARLAEIQKAQARAAHLQAGKGAAVPSAPGAATTRTAAATTVAASSSTSLSPAKAAQFNGIVDEGRGMARTVMRSGNPANVQLARNYDSYLKTLKDSFRGVTNDREADKLIGQARQTRNYLTFLVKQSSR